MAALFHSVIFWVTVTSFAITTVWTVIRSIRQEDEGATPKFYLTLIGLLMLLFAVYFPIAFTLEHILPDYGFFHGTSEDGEPFDRREVIAFWIALPVTYLLIRGFNAWKKDKGGI